MNNRFDISKAPPLRAEPRHATASAAAHVQSVPATPGGLIRSTLIAAGAAGAILVLFWLPAEYGIDPTGVGALTGLTEMGEIKQQLAAEAEADAQAAATGVALPAPASVAVPAEIVQRLDRIDAQLAALAAVIGAPPAAVAPAASDPVDAPAAAAAPVADPATAAADPVEAAVVEAAAPEWRDEVSYTLNPGEGVEVKLVMEVGQVARFAWTANGGVVNFDLHGDGSDQETSYEQGRAVPEAWGDLTAAFTGNHGWFWRNRSEAPVTVTLRTGGEYSELRAP